jgi:hypothetical protein
MLLIINMNNPTMNISKYMIDKKIMQKKILKMWNGLSGIKIYNNHII